MSRRKPSHRSSRPPRPQNFAPSGLDAATFASPNRSITFYPSLDPRFEANSANLNVIWRRARSLYANSPEVGLAVKSLVSLTGILMPRPASSDERWNDEARRAFLARVNSPLWESSGKLNWRQAQLYMERRAVIDGDILSVFGRDRDGGSTITFFAAPQVRSGESPASAEASFSAGVETDSAGRPARFHVYNYLTAESTAIDAAHACLYMHEPDPGSPRGLSELVRCVNTAQDVAEINEFNKTAVKTSASIAFVEVKNLADKAADRSIAQARNSGSSTPALPERPMEVAGSKVVSLMPGRDLKVLHDNRPSNETREFVRDLVRSVAYSVGLDPEVLYYVASMGSASVRFSLQKLREWTVNRLTDREVWANAVYQRVIASEIAAGRLRPCPAADWLSVRWIPRTDMTIDRGRDGALMIKLIGAGLASANAYTLATEGKTVEELGRERIHDLAHLRDLAESAGLSLPQLFPEFFAAPGSPAVESPSPSSVPPQAPDDEPESSPREAPKRPAAARPIGQPRRGCPVRGEAA